MKSKIIMICSILLCLLLSGCGRDPALEQFKEDFEVFCINISTLDTSINSIDPSADDAKEKLLDYIDQLDSEFQNLAQMDFPEEFDYLEPLADSADQYMSEAASAYHTAYSGETYAENYNDYAYENYKRAYKRIQVLIAYLHGEEPQDADLADESDPGSDSE